MRVLRVIFAWSQSDFGTDKMDFDLSHVCSVVFLFPYLFELLRGVGFQRS